MSIKKGIRRHILEAPLYFRCLRARWDAAAEKGGTYHIVIPFRTYKVYREHMLGLVDCLEAVGRRTILHPVKRFRQVGRLQRGDRVLAFAPYRLEAFERTPGVLYAAVNSEQYPETAEELKEGLHLRGKGFLTGCHLVFECHEALEDRARALGLKPAGVLPFGYTDRWNWGAFPVQPRYDVAFLGRFSSDHRRELWGAVKDRFRVCPRNEAWGKRRPGFLRSARIQLNFSQTEVALLAGHRFAMMLANRCFLLSETLPPGSPFKAGVHYAEASSSTMIDAIARYLERKDLRASIAQAGHDFVRNEYRLETHVNRILPVLDFAMEAVLDDREPGAGEDEYSGLESGQ